MIDLSLLTRSRMRSVFSASHHAAVEEMLITECGDKLPLVDVDYFELVERIQFAALKLSDGHIERLQRHLNDAKIDWRDVLVSADFAEDARAHLEWKPGMSR